jgi:hypothetical protein
MGNDIVTERDRGSIGSFGQYENRFSLVANRKKRRESMRA